MYTVKKILVSSSANYAQLPLFEGFCVWTLFCYTVLNALSFFAIILMGKRERAGCFTLIVFQMVCDF